MTTVGRDVESICNKCGDVWHVVLAMVDRTIAKVQCKECGAQHRYRPSDGVAPSRPARRSEASAKGKRPARARASSAPKIMADPSRPIRPYAVTERFAAGDPIDHQQFGMGVVQEALESDKIAVHFTDRERVLVHGRNT